MIVLCHFIQRVVFEPKICHLDHNRVRVYASLKSLFIFVGFSEMEDSPYKSSVSDDTQESYVPLRVLGKGAFGQAVLYKRDDDNCLVVWKEVELPKVSDEEKDSTFNEVEILSLLDHFNIISYYNHFFDDYTLYIEMEYANGGTLFEKIRDAKELFPEDDCWWYFYQLMSAVFYIHNNGILHRDIKPENLVFDQ